MLDDVLARIRASRLGHLDHGRVNQARSASALFYGNFSGTTTIKSEFANTRLGLGVMHDLEGELVSLRGTTWRVPIEGTPEVVDPGEEIAFGIAATGGIAHTLYLQPGLTIDEILQALDAYLLATHVDHEHVVCALEIHGTFSDAVLRTVGHPDWEGESLGEVLDHETRFSFPQWSGTLVGFRYPDTTNGATIPGLHLHGISDDRQSGGHLRNATTGVVRASVWIDDLHLAMGDETPAADGGGSTPIDFGAYEGPVK